MTRAALTASCIVLALVFAGLGVWQLDRLAWKLDLIERVNARVRDAPAPPPAPGVAVSRKNHEYLRVLAKGVLLHDRETLVQALTERGAGWWVITPLQTASGVILVNRGFVPDERRIAATRRPDYPGGPVTVIGLLRMTEPRGGFLRANDPEGGRWYSRDVAAIARARHLAGVAPYFIDADATPNTGGYPVGGLTTIAFRNVHLVYALTWFALSALSLFGLVVIHRLGRKA